MPSQAVFFDVANTLLHKPALVPTIHGVLARRGVAVSRRKLSEYHRLLSEVITFPDSTSRDFYCDFNAHLLRILGVVPDQHVLDEIHERCRELPWAAYDDTDCLAGIAAPLGVLSNWDASLAQKLGALIDAPFRWTLGSAEQGVRKPDPAFFRRMLECVGANPAAIVYVGDSIRLDLEPALRLGIKAVLIDRDGHYAGAPVPRIESLRELDRWL